MEKLSHLKLVKVTGRDATTFLQGQLTNDITALKEDWHYSAYCTPKGRALAVFLVWRSNDDIFLLLEESVKESVLKRLKMYVMRSQVTFEDVDVDILGVFESEIVSSTHVELSTGQDKHTATITQDTWFLHLGGRAIAIDFKGGFQSLYSGEDEKAKNWLFFDIQECLPRVSNLSSELFIPQMLNLDLLNGISFKKGCYTGQEIIARMKYLGKLKQRMFVCKVLSDKPAIIGAKVVDDDGKVVGNVANSEASSQQANQHITAVLRVDNINNGLTVENGPRLEVSKQQPYPLEQQ